MEEKKRVESMVTDMKEEKRRLREAVLRLRNAVAEEERREKSGVILEKAARMEEYRRASALLIYADFGSEVETRPLMLRALDEGKEVYCPRVEGRNMKFYRIHRLGDLTESFRGIAQPAADENGLFAGYEDDFLVLMPGVAFDREGNRIGYGGGYYDRFLDQCQGRAASIAVCFDCQVVERIPAEENDRKPGKVVTESQIICSGSPGLRPYAE